MHRQQKHQLVAISTLLLTMGLTGCFSVSTPRGFVELETTAFPYKAVSAQGAVLTVRRFDNGPEAKLHFWKQVLADELVQQRGYTIANESAVRTKEGVLGHRFRFKGRYRGEEHAYQLAVFVTSSWVYLLEATAPAKDFSRYERAAQLFVASFKP
ncbi:MAG: hypothetical protein JRH20_27995 [Deltaproteobacteria bacterium]|nr:hypothetical protein [Deltaproteobacteria bacterium]